VCVYVVAGVTSRALYLATATLALIHVGGLGRLLLRRGRIGL
jgi:hypothetical protein